MRVHITNLYGLRGAAGAAQQRVAEIARNSLDYNELGIYCYQVDSDSPEMLRTRIDGIIAAVGWNDTVIFQSPTWNGIAFDERLMLQLSAYGGLKKIFFIHDIPPLMFEANRWLLKQYIDLYNRADLIILPSENMANFLRTEGLNVSKIVVQKMWDFPVSIDFSIHPQFKRVISFAGDANMDKFSFVKEWKYDTVKLLVTAAEGDWQHDEKVEFIGWFRDQNRLANALRGNGGFGLLWTEHEYTREYMRLCACFKVSLYIAAGIPVIVPDSIPEANTIVRKNLGFAVTTLDEAIDKVESITEEQYGQMIKNVAEFGELVRGGFFTKKLLTDAVFKLLYD
ncbi:MAG: sugar transferase [Lachnospiraceae bacterium]|nr:sugar transferase [Lachnospiraceae bacterium]MDE7009084.1 sugar transferase [Lachnospiraceae bacterium]